MPAFGLGTVLNHLPATGRRETARRRLGGTNEPAVPSPPTPAEPPPTQPVGSTDPTRVVRGPVAPGARRGRRRFAARGPRPVVRGGRRRLAAGAPYCPVRTCSSSARSVQART